MKEHNTIKLNQAQEQLGIQIPADLFDFIANLKTSEVQFGKEEWLFWTINDDKDDKNENFIVSSSLNFKEEWKLNGLVFATNGIGDYLLLLQAEDSDMLSENIFVMMHETAEIKLFANDLNELIEYGPEDYFWNKEFYLKLDDENKIVRWTDPIQDENNADDHDGSDDLELYDEDYRLRSRLDDLIDDQSTDLASEIIQGLEKLSDCSDETHKAWALNKLSDIYLKGFGPIPQNLDRAFEYNQMAMDLNSHKAYSNRAACYFFGMGTDKDLDKALEYAIKANEISKANIFADILAIRKDGGMYDGLVEMIKKEIKKSKK